MAYIANLSTVTANDVYKTYGNLREAFTNVFNYIHKNKDIQAIVMNDLETYKHLNMTHFIVYNFKTCVNKENCHKMSGYIARINGIIQKTKTPTRVLENFNKICVAFVGETLKYTSINLFVHIETPNANFETLQSHDIYDVVNDITPVAYCVPFSSQTFGLMCVYQDQISTVFDKINSHIAVLNDDDETRVKLYCAENYTLFKSIKKVFDWASKGQTEYVNLTSDTSLPLSRVIEHSVEWSSRE
jgi:hypothetical protein